jgi:hydroxymethylbilane synthase
VIGTRGSSLAVWQAEYVAARLRDRWPGLDLCFERIRTTGDKILDVPLARVGGKALFVKEIEEALLSGRVDLAVHSMKDVPTELPPGLAIVAMPEREDPADVLISRTGARLAALPRGARVGTSSLRRQAQLLRHRPDLTIVGLRGNLDTRVRKLDSEGLDAIILAAAGVKRLGLDHLVTEALPPEVLLPAVGQGALGIEVRTSSRGAGEQGSGGARGQGSGGAEERGRRGAGAKGSEGAGERGSGGAEGPGSRGAEELGRRGAEAEQRTSGVERGTLNVERVVMVLDHRETHLAVRAERAMLRRLGGGCLVPIAAWATVEGDAILLRGLIAGIDGSTLVRGDARGTTADPDGLGAALAEDLLARGGRTILDRIAGDGVDV